MDMNVKKGISHGKCMACGWQGDLDNNHRIAAFIQRNPPDEGGHSIQTPGEEKGSKLDKQAKREKRLKEQREAAKSEDAINEDKNDSDGYEADDKEEKKE